MPCHWSDSEKEFVRQNAGLLKDEEIAASLSRLTGHAFTLYAVRKIRKQLGIHKQRGRGVNRIDKREGDLDT